VDGLYDRRIACGRYLSYIKDNASDGRVLIRANNTVIFTSHEQLDKWHKENYDNLGAEEQVSLSVCCAAFVESLQSYGTFERFAQIFPI
jgi:hypothetical protein